ncbi:MAG: metal-dependent phosphohydrolase [Actinobacteria bacterium]|nr:metal-dependent phosphohydrolase [Actinomycetota bacterium]
MQLVRAHVETGFAVLVSGNIEVPLAALVHQHHERCDGSGYPHGLREADLLLGARILSVADVVEAMISHRPYRAILGVDQALAEIEQGACTRYDAAVVASCCRLFREKGFAFNAAGRDNRRGAGTRPR